MEDSTHENALDPLSEVLGLIRVERTVYFHAEFSEPWSLQIEQGPRKFHYLLQGQCHVDFGGGTEIRLDGGDLLLTPGGKSHRLSGSEKSKALRADALSVERISDRYYVTRLGGGGAPCTIICGDLRFDASCNHLLDHLPDFIHLPREGTEHDERTYTILRFLAAEAKTPSPGSEAVVLHLADLLVIQSIRMWLLNSPKHTRSWIRGLKDPLIGKALALLHRDYGKQWTIDSLAAAVGTSRSLLARRFNELTGVGVIEYLTGWRMTKALQSMEMSNRTLDAIAQDVGYSSLAAFSKAFKRRHGHSPSGYFQRSKKLETAGSALSS